MVRVKLGLIGVVAVVAVAVAIPGCAQTRFARPGRNDTTTLGDLVGEGLRPYLEQWVSESIDRKIRESGVVLMVLEGRYLLVRPEGATVCDERLREAVLPTNELIRSLEEWLLLSSPLDRLPTELADRQYADCLLLVGVTDDTPCEMIAAVQSAVRTSGQKCTLWPVVIRPPWEDEAETLTAARATLGTRSARQ